MENVENLPIFFFKGKKQDWRASDIEETAYIQSPKGLDETQGQTPYCPNGEQWHGARLDK